MFGEQDQNRLKRTFGASAATVGLHGLFLLIVLLVRKQDDQQQDPQHDPHDDRHPVFDVRRLLHDRLVIVREHHRSLPREHQVQNVGVNERAQRKTEQSDARKNRRRNPRPRSQPAKSDPHPQLSATDHQ
jgi:hypothetical protein